MLPYFENKPKKIFIAHYDCIHTYPPHFHNNIEIAYCFSGIQKIKAGNIVYTLKKGDAIVVFPNIVHEYIDCDPLSDEDTESISLICSCDLFLGNIPSVKNTRPESPFISASSISKNTALAFREMSSKPDELELLGWTYIVLSDLIKNLTLCPIKNSENLKIAPQIIEYINSNFKEPLSIEYIAKKFGYNPSYIAHIFSDKLKIPFKTYICAVRCEYAAMLIRTTDKSLTEISYESGYDYLNTFGRCFKRHFGQTPSQYKKLFKEQ